MLSAFVEQLGRGAPSPSAGASSVRCQERDTASPLPLLLLGGGQPVYVGHPGGFYGGGGWFGGGGFGGGDWGCDVGGGDW